MSSDPVHTPVHSGGTELRQGAFAEPTDSSDRRPSGQLAKDLINSLRYQLATGIQNLNFEFEPDGSIDRFSIKKLRYIARSTPRDLFAITITAQKLGYFARNIFQRLGAVLELQPQLKQSLPIHLAIPETIHVSQSFGPAFDRKAQAVVQFLAKFREQRSHALLPGGISKAGELVIGELKIKFLGDYDPDHMVENGSNIKTSPRGPKSSGRKSRARQRASVQGIYEITATTEGAPINAPLADFAELAAWIAVDPHIMQPEWQRAFKGIRLCTPTRIGPEGENQRSDREGDQPLDKASLPSNIASLVVQKSPNNSPEDSWAKLRWACEQFRSSILPSDSGPIKGLVDATLAMLPQTFPEVDSRSDAARVVEELDSWLEERKKLVEDEVISLIDAREEELKLADKQLGELRKRVTPETLNHLEAQVVAEQRRVEEINDRIDSAKLELLELSESSLLLEQAISGVNAQIKLARAGLDRKQREFDELVVKVRSFWDRLSQADVKLLKDMGVEPGAPKLDSEIIAEPDRLTPTEPDEVIDVTEEDPSLPEAPPVSEIGESETEPSINIEVEQPSSITAGELLEAVLAESKNELRNKLVACAATLSDEEIYTLADRFSELTSLLEEHDSRADFEAVLLTYLEPLVLTETKYIVYRELLRRVLELASELNDSELQALERVNMRKRPDLYHSSAGLIEVANIIEGL